MSKGHPTITVTVVTGRGEKSYTLPQETKVSEVIQRAVEDFGYPAGDRYVLTRQKTGEELKPERPLVSYGIGDGEILVLSAVGSGV
jgi:hypothetical protein